MSVKQQIKTYVAENFIFSSNGFDLDEDESFLDAGVVDSLGVLELVTFVEETFTIQVADDEIVPDNFDSVNNMSAYIERKQWSGARVASGKSFSAPLVTPLDYAISK